MHLVLMSAALLTIYVFTARGAESPPVASAASDQYLAGNAEDGMLAMRDLAVIRPDVKTGFSHGGWNVDRYTDLDPLNAHTTITVADLHGPGIITHIHTTRHLPAKLFARGIVLEVWFDEAAEPAVMCPLADFFGDGCNGASMDFSANLIECAPWSYNCYFPMPFRKRARVTLRNDTDTNATNYSYVEWESLPEWKEQYGYFHATYHRKTFRLLKDTDETFFKIEGTGHLIGRQFSVVTDDPAFTRFTYLMEGNNEIDIDGEERVIDYLGSEDSFGFSWGFLRTFAGRRAGMPLVDIAKPDTLHRLSIYRFHDHMPIRFTKDLHWHINWGHDGDPSSAYWSNVHGKSRALGGCWVDYATVHYWYHSVPGGYEHKPLRPVGERTKALLRSSLKGKPNEEQQAGEP